MTRPATRLLRHLLPPLLLLGTALPAQSPFAQHPPALPADRIDGAAAITLEQCRQWVYALASPEFEGRQTGTEGYRKAADYVAKHFAALGLEARGSDGTYFQHMPWTAVAVQPEQCAVTFTKDGEEVLLVPAERLAGSVGASLQAEGELVLLVVTPPPRPEGDGNRRTVRMPEIPGLAALDVAGKIVLTYVKPAADGTGTMARFAVTRALADKNPAALLFAQDEAVTGGLRPSRAGRGGRQPATLTIGGEDLRAVLAAGGVDPAVLRGDLLAPPIALSATVALAAAEAQAPAMNVFAVLPGSDPKRKDEYVVIGSHLDHMGRRGDTFYPGADDDASGTAGVMAIAQMLVKNGVRPARSVLFVCFAGEEDGLVGSHFFTENPPVPLAQMVAQLQLDMIGRDEESRSEKAADNRDSLHVVGSSRLSPALHELCMAKNAIAGFRLEDDQEGMFGGSDHASFAYRGVPVAFFFTGLHRDYHQTTDTPDRIHYEKLLRVATYVYDVAFELAQQAERPRIDPELWDNLRGKRGLEPAAPLLPGK